MRESIGTTSIFQIMLALIFIFVAFIAIAINYNRAYRVKNQAISIFERYEGTRPITIEILNTYLINNGYSDRGKCPTGYYGSTNLNTNTLERATDKKTYFYCVSSTKVKEGIKYNIRVFSKFSIPLLGDLLTFKISGETKSVKLTNASTQMLR